MAQFSMRKMVEAGEAGLGRLAGQLLSNEKFVGAIQAIVARALEAKGTVDKSLQAALATMNLPSRADVEAVERKLDELERLLSEVEARLAKLEEPSAEAEGRE
jgi:polyhydroxyalkanoate synthesis regulator phasin